MLGDIQTNDLAEGTPLLYEGLDAQNLKGFFFQFGHPKNPTSSQLFGDLWVCVLVLFLSTLSRNEMFLIYLSEV